MKKISACIGERCVAACKTRKHGVVTCGALAQFTGRERAYVHAGDVCVFVPVVRREAVQGVLW